MLSDSSHPAELNIRLRQVWSAIISLKQINFLAIGLALVWLLVLIGRLDWVSVQGRSWLAFIALLVTPGYFLGDMITWRMRLDNFDRLGLALPLSVVVLAVPGICALLFHLTITQLVAGWIAASGQVLLGWFIHRIGIRVLGQLCFSRPDAQPTGQAWAFDEVVMLLLLIIAFIVIMPTLSLYKIDGDAYAVNAFTADALAGLPLNATEPIFGTTIGPGVRMVFNQSLTMTYLWAQLAAIDPITLTAEASRSMIAVWAILAAYVLGKAAGGGDRRLGLLTASVQLLIYMAAPFFRGDNVSLFFFERTNADKFMVPITLLPIVFAFTFWVVREGRGDAWLAAAAATFAVSTIHPLIALMLALGLGAFGIIHLTLDVRVRLMGGEHWGKRRVALRLNSQTALRRTLALWLLIPVVMFLPLVQLVLSRGEAPLAASYPRSFEGWPIGQKQVPALPFIYLPTLTVYGPLPDLTTLEPADAFETTNPFLIWRFAVNAERRRLLMFGLNYYISDPGLILEPPYLLALCLVPLLLWGIRRNIAAQFAVGVTLAILFVMFNPIVTPIIGALVMPWILWRFIWLLPYALIIAMVVHRLLVLNLPAVLDRLKAGWLTKDRAEPLGVALLLATLLAAILSFSPSIARNLQAMHDRSVAPYFFPTPKEILAYLTTATARTGSVIVLADADLSVTIPAYVANANIVAHRAPTTSEVFPANQQDIALQRLIDQDRFFRTTALTTDSVEILQRYNVRYIVTASGSDIDLQLHLAPQWFEWLLDDQSYSLYQVRQLPTETASIRGNTALVNRDWDAARQLYQEALAQTPGDLLALIGLAELARTHGQSDDALQQLQAATAQIDKPILHFRLGQLYAERGQLKDSRAEFALAQQAAPHVSRFHIALGDACLDDGDENCAAEQYHAAAATEILPDEAARLIAEADLWRQRGRTDRALPLYEQAVASQPNEFNQFVMERVYREVGAFDQAAALVDQLRRRHPFSAEVAAVAANVRAEQSDIDGAVSLYRQAIWLQNLKAQESIETQLALAQLLLETDRLTEAEREIERILEFQPYNATGYRLRGNLYQARDEFPQAVAAYQRAFELDPTQVAVYVSLSTLLREHGGRSAGILEVLQIATHLNPDEATLYLALGDQYQESGDTQAAIAAYQLALEKFDLYQLSAQLHPRSNDQSRAFTYTRLGQAYESLGQLEPAFNDYRAALAIAPDMPWIQVMLGNLYRRQNDFQGAETAYRRALELDPTYTNASLELAEIFIEQARYDEAEGILSRILAGDAHNVEGLVRLGELEQRRGNLARALAWYRQAASGPIDNQPINITLIGSLLQYNDYETALAYVQQAVSLRPDDGQVLLQLGRIERALGHYGEAESALLRAQQSLPADTQLYTERAELYLAKGDPQTALTLYEQAMALQPAEVRNCLTASQILVSQGKSDAALTLLEQGLGRVSQPADLYVAMANLYLQLGHPDQALATIERGLSAVGEVMSLRLALGDYYASRADFERAKEEYTRALTLQPDAGPAHRALAGFYLHLGQTAEAIAEYKQAITLKPDDPLAYQSLGDAYHRAGQMDEAIAAYNQALSLSPSVVTAYVGLGAVYREQGRLDEAKAIYEKGLTLVPTSGRLLTDYSALLIERGEKDQALKILSRVTDVAPTADTLIARAALYRQVGWVQDAHWDLQIALQKEPGSVNVLIAQGDQAVVEGDLNAAQQHYEAAVALRPGLAVGYLRLGSLANSRGDRPAAEKYVEQARQAEPGALAQTAGQAANPDDES